MPHRPTLLVAGTHSGSGKTSLTLALTRALTRRGLRVQTFKVGPDFLDPTYLALASGRPCYNLDGWMAGQDHVRGLFERAAADADCALIEGVMGLFDGADPANDEGSTAEIARWLDAPILLVANVHGMGRSIAALVKGFTSFAADLRFAGVVANHCGSERHAAWLADSLRAAGPAAARRGDPAGGVPRARPPPPRPRHRRPGATVRGPLRRFRNGPGAPPFPEELFPGATPWSGPAGQPLWSPAAEAGTGPARPLQDRRGAGRRIPFLLPGPLRRARRGRMRDGLLLAADRSPAARGDLRPLPRRRIPRGPCGGPRGKRGDARRDPRVRRLRETPLRRMRRADVPLGGADGGWPLSPLPRDPPRPDADAGRKEGARIRRGYAHRRFALGKTRGCRPGTRVPLLGADRRPGRRSRLAAGLRAPAAPPDIVEAEGFQKGAILASYTHLYYAAHPAAIDHFINRLGGTP